MSESDKLNVDRSWMNLNDRFCKEYKDGVLSFLEVAGKVVNERGKTRCPCIKCLNTTFVTLRDIREHLHVHGICRGYTRWTYHGENLGQCSRSEIESENENDNDNDNDDDDGMMNILNDMHENAFPDFGMGNPDFKALSTQNSQSRAQLPYMHKGGSKLNANKHHKMLQEDLNTTWVDEFEKQHSYGPDKWVSDLTEKQHLQMFEYMNPLAISESDDGSETIESRPSPLSAIESMEKTLGSRSGYIRGMDRGSKPLPRTRASSTTFGPSQSEIETQKKLDETIQSMEVMRESLTQQQELTRTLQEQIARQSTQIEEQSAQIEERSAQLAQFAERSAQFAEQSAQLAQLMRMWQASQGGGSSTQGGEDTQGGGSGGT